MGKRTDKLDKALENLKPEGLSEFLNKYWTEMLDGDREFTKFMHENVAKKNLRWKDVYIAAGISEKYGHEIISMRKHTTNRDLIIKLCLAMQLSVDDTRHALILYGMPPLYSRTPKDAVIIVAINNRIFDLVRINDMLTEQGCELIATE